MPDGDVDVGVAGVPGVPEEAGVTMPTELLEVTGVDRLMGDFGDVGEDAILVTSKYEHACECSGQKSRNTIINNNPETVIKNDLNNRILTVSCFTT